MSEFVPLEHLIMEREVYRDLTRLSYSGKGSMSKLVNDAVKEYLHTYILAKNIGHVLVPKEVMRIAVNEMNEEQIRQASALNAIRYKEGVILDGGKPSLIAYIGLIKAFVKANRFNMDLSKNPENGNTVLIVQFMMGAKYGQFLGSTYRILLEEFCDIIRTEMTDSTVYFEYKPK